ncbi:hypothetical protein KR018_010858 [Drosophila ironensis]|nr:hypothetical protein KR018_010858 [Drosophila ironensis]
MPRICLLALLGLPGAGKSSLCAWLQGQPLGPICVLHLRFDDFLEARPPAPLAHKQQRSLVLQIVEQLVAALQGTAPWPAQVQPPREAPDLGSRDYLILCDDNFYYRSMRRKLQQLARSAGCLYGQLYIARPLSACLEANALREASERVPEEVVRRMQDRIEPPGAEAWEGNSLILAEAHSTLARQAVLQFLDKLMAQKVPVPSAQQAQPAQQATQDQTPAHQLDLRLRARIKELLGEGAAGAESKRAAGERLNGQRRRILQQFRDEEEETAKARAADLNYYVNLLN